MSEAKHTPGPWMVFKNGEPILVKSQAFLAQIEDCTGKFVSIAANTPTNEITNSVMFANADLIAAAPELLEACKMARAIYQSIGCETEIAREQYDFIGNAIAKAEGKEEL